MTFNVTICINIFFFCFCLSKFKKSFSTRRSQRYCSTFLLKMLSLPSKFLHLLYLKLIFLAGQMWGVTHTHSHPHPHTLSTIYWSPSAVPNYLNHCPCHVPSITNTDTAPPGLCVPPSGDALLLGEACMVPTALPPLN